MWRDDWPERGATIDPDVDDLPHPDCGTEWWYLHAHVTDEAGGEHSLMLVFVRLRDRDEDGQPLNGHLVFAGHTDRTRGLHVGESWLDSGLVDVMRSNIKRDTELDANIRAAFSEVLTEQRPIPPDQLITSDVVVDPDALDLSYGEVASLRKLPDGVYRITFSGGDTNFDLVLSLTKPPIPQFEHEAMAARYSEGECDTYSYFAPRLAVTGHVGDSQVSGIGWYEHAFGGEWFRAGTDENIVEPTWIWVGAQLDNGWDIAAASGGYVDITARSDHHQEAGTAYSPTGERVPLAVQITAGETWTSLSTLNTYPLRCAVSAPALELDLVVEAVFPRQEHRTLTLTGAFQEACATVSGTLRGEPVRGHAYLEVLPANRIGRFEQFLTRLHELTQDEVRALYPDQPGAAVTEGLAGADPSGLPHDTVHDALVRPMRHIADVSGRGWRTFVACAAIELFDQRCDPYTPLLAVAELVHCGCLVIDDVEDGSPLRRGIPAAHVLYGVPTAINAGTEAYFALDRVLPQILPDDDRLWRRVYQSYLRGMRSAHVGQGLDIAGHRAAMDLAVDNGDSAGLVAAVRGTLRLKTGAAARAFGEIGALIAGASDEQVSAAGDYFEMVGLAYQITDDVMDLEGVTRRLDSDEVVATKHVAEDLRAGKVTMPLAHAVGLLSIDRMSAVWQAVRDGGADEATVREVAEILVECGAVQACYDDAKAHVDRAWSVLEPLLPGTYLKVMVRALGFYAALRERDPETPRLVGSVR
jgi:geranylgeranyl pyrophosphate synthase/predicted secreted hydrolase